MTAEGIEIRPAVEADRFALEEWLMEPEVLQFYPMSNLQEVREAVKGWLFYTRMNSVYTITVDHKPAGMALLYVQPVAKLKHQSLFAIVVGGKYRNRGLGTKLMEYLIDQAKNTFHMQYLYLEVYEGNPAYNLYKRLGFKEFARHPRFLKEANGTYSTKILMQLEWE